MHNLITLYQQRLNLQDATFSRIDHEDATVAIVFKITLHNGIQLILKICPRHQYLREVYFLRHFTDTLPVPRIIQVIEPQTDIDGAILMEFLPGTLLKTTDLTDSLSYEIGSLLARIHLNRAPGYGDLTKPADLNIDPRIHFTQKFNEGLTECSNHLPSRLIEQCRNYFDTHLDLLSAADGPCIVHRDFRPGNLIVHNDKVQGIIDWSSARASFAQEDFCPMDYEDWPANPTGEKSFLAGYASIRPIPDYNAMMPLLRLSRAIATIGFTIKRGTWNNVNARMFRLIANILRIYLKSKSKMRKIFLIVSIMIFTITTPMSNITREIIQDKYLESKNIIIPPIPFYFVRHGQTDWNKEHKVMGQIDIPLNDTGIKQAQIAAQNVARLDIAHIVSSPLKRTTQTAEIIANATNRSVAVVDELIECCMGIMEGQDKGDGTWFDNWIVGGNIDGAEHWSHFVSRIAIGLNRALTHNIDAKPILIVAHRPTFWALLSILNIQDDLNAENCDVYFFKLSDLDSNQWKVEALNCLK